MIISVETRKEGKEEEEEGRGVVAFCFSSFAFFPFLRYGIHETMILIISTQITRPSVDNELLSL